MLCAQQAETKQIWESPPDAPKTSQFRHMQTNPSFAISDLYFLLEHVLLWRIAFEWEAHSSCVQRNKHEFTDRLPRGLKNQISAMRPSQVENQVKIEKEKLFNHKKVFIYSFMMRRSPEQRQENFCQSFRFLISENLESEAHPTSSPSSQIRDSSIRSRNERFICKLRTRVPSLGFIS